MRKHIGLLVALLIIFSASSLHAQLLAGIGFDTSLKVEYLFGYQKQQYSLTPTGPNHRFNFDPSLWMLSGMLEATPFPSLSARLGGSFSLGTKPQENIKDKIVDTINQRKFDQTPNYYTWEAAGLYHLWNAEGYRFSFVAGYKMDDWRYNPADDNVRAKDQMISNIPFIGLQTSMLFPWWKARFEVLGSPFMSRRILSYQPYNDTFFEGRAAEGGMMEIRWEGAVGITPNLFVGANAAYSFIDLNGNADRRRYSPPGATEIKFYTGDSMFRVGLDLNFVY